MEVESESEAEADSLELAMEEDSKTEAPTAATMDETKEICDGNEASFSTDVLQKAAAHQQHASTSTHNNNTLKSNWNHAHIAHVYMHVAVHIYAHIHVLWLTKIPQRPVLVFVRVWCCCCMLFVL